MTSIAAWGIFDLHGKRVVKLPYNARADAERLVALMNEKDPPKPREDGSSPGPKFYLNMIKEPLTALPNQLALVLAWPRRIAGTSEDKKTGEVRRWMKTFHHVEVHSVVEGRYVLTEEFVTHVHKGELRVNGPCGRKTRDEFEAWAKERWPEGWPQVMIRIEG